MATPGNAAADAASAAAEPGADSHSAKAPAPTEQDRIAELDDRWRRAVADLDNLRKRHAVELAQVRESERARVTAAWLPVLDNLELALAHADANPDTIVQGVLAIRDQAVQMLAALGYPRNDETGVPFDPNRHEVVAVVNDAEAEPNTVVRVVRPGYGTVGHELRPTAVAVSGSRE